MVAFCSCFRAPQAKYECTEDALGPLSKAQTSSAEHQQQQPALQASASPVKTAAKPVSPVNHIPRSMRASAPALLQHQHQAAVAGGHVERTPLTAVKQVMSHKISISPTGERGISSPDSDRADTDRHDNVTTPTRSFALVPAPQELVANPPLMSEASLPTTQQPVALPAAADFAAAADVACKSSRAAAGGSDSPRKAAVAAAAAAGKNAAAKMMKTPSSNRKSSAGGARTPVSAGQITPVRQMHMAQASSKGFTPSPSVARPTCASMSRAQAVAETMAHHTTNSGHWKL